MCILKRKEEGYSHLYLFPSGEKLIGGGNSINIFDTYDDDTTFSHSTVIDGRKVTLIPGEEEILILQYS